MGGFLFVVYLLVFILKIILYTCKRRLQKTYCFPVYDKGYNMRIALGETGTRALRYEVPHIKINPGVSGRF